MWDSASGLCFAELGWGFMAADGPGGTGGKREGHLGSVSWGVRLQVTRVELLETEPPEWTRTPRGL